MNLPKNVVNNNAMRAYLIDCATLKLIATPDAPKRNGKKIFGWILEEHGETLKEFVKTHQDTCAVYEVVLTTILIAILWFCVFTCPRCGKQLRVTVGG